MQEPVFFYLYCNPLTTENGPKSTFSYITNPFKPGILSKSHTMSVPEGVQFRGVSLYFVSRSIDCSYLSWPGLFWVVNIRPGAWPLNTFVTSYYIILSVYCIKTWHYREVNLGQIIYSHIVMLNLERGVTSYFKVLHRGRPRASGHVRFIWDINKQPFRILLYWKQGVLYERNRS